MLKYCKTCIEKDEFIYLDLLKTLNPSLKEKYF